MKDSDIIKALECCLELNCKECPCWAEEVDACCYGINEDVLLDLIKRQQAEIEKLRGWENLLKAEKHSLIKAEAIKEFTKRLKKEAHEYECRQGYLICAVEVEDIDDLIKEMVGK